MIIMDKTKNIELKDRLISEKNKDGFIFSKPSHTPFIGDKYTSSKILFIGDQKIKLDECAMNNGKERDFPAFNVCSQIICLNEKLKNFIESEIKTEVECVAYYNFFFDRHESNVSIPNSGAKGEELAKYHQALALVIKELRPSKIIFWGKDVLTKINRVKRPRGFDGATFEEYTKKEKINVETINIHNISSKKKFQAEKSTSNNSGLKTCINKIKKISKLLNETLDLDFGAEKMDILNKKFYEDINPEDELFAEGMSTDNIGTCSLYLCLRQSNSILQFLLNLQKEINGKKVYRSEDERKMERTASYSQWMLVLLEESDLFIAHTLVPTMLKYIEKTFELDDEMNPQLNDGKEPTIEEFQEYLKNKPKAKAVGIGNTLKGIYQHFNHSSDPRNTIYALIMKKRIFIGTKGRQFNNLVNNATLTELKRDQCAKEWKPNIPITD